MSATLLGGAIVFAQIALTLAMALAVLRMIRGPRAQDRVLALDTLYINAMLFFLTLGIRTTNADGAYYDSRESGANAPQLVVTTGPAPAAVTGVTIAAVGVSVRNEPSLSSASATR